MIIGMTGGIASGKSSAAKILGDWGAHVIDADKLGHKAYLAGTQAFDQVVKTFGQDTVGTDGEIDRRVLGSKVFGQPDQLQKLTDIVWPAIRMMAQAEIESVRAAHPDKIIVLEAAVLIEAGWRDLVDTLWVCVVDRDIAVTRACARDGFEASAVEARIDAQLTNEERIKAADVVIDNSGEPEHMLKQLQDLWDQIGAAKS